MSVTGYGYALKYQNFKLLRRPTLDAVARNSNEICEILNLDDLGILVDKVLEIQYLESDVKLLLNPSENHTANMAFVK